MRQCPNCGTTQKKHDAVACEEYELWLDRRDYSWSSDDRPPLAP